MFIQTTLSSNSFHISHTLKINSFDVLPLFQVNSFACLFVWKITKNICKRDNINIREVKWKIFHVLCSHLIYYLCQENIAVSTWSEKFRSWILKIFILAFSCWLFTVQWEESLLQDEIFYVVIFSREKTAFAFINHSRMFKWSIHPFIKSLFYLDLIWRQKSW